MINGTARNKLPPLYPARPGVLQFLCQNGIGFGHALAGFTAILPEAQVEMAHAVVTEEEDTDALSRSI